MSERSTRHSTFVLEHLYAAAPARVFKAGADPQAKARWFAGPDDWKTGLREMDFRVGGRERLNGGPADGPVHAFDCFYQDIVPDERIVYSYDMHLDERRISVSLATVGFKTAGSGTRLIFTEQDVFLDGYDEPGSREEGSRGLLDKLDVYLRS